MNIKEYSNYPFLAYCLSLFKITGGLSLGARLWQSFASSTFVDILEGMWPTSDPSLQWTQRARIIGQTWELAAFFIARGAVAVPCARAAQPCVRGQRGFGGTILDHLGARSTTWFMRANSLQADGTVDFNPDYLREPLRVQHNGPALC